MSFLKLQTYLNKFKNFKKEHADLKLIIKNTLQEEVGVVLGDEKISVVQNRIFIKESAIIKNEILFKKQIILEKIRARAENSKLEII